MYRYCTVHVAVSQMCVWRTVNCWCWIASVRQYFSFMVTCCG